MLTTLLHLVMNPWSLYGLLALAGIAVGLYLTAGPQVLLKVVGDVRAWFALAFLLALLAFAHAEQRADRLETQIAGIERQADADKDATKTTTLRVQQKAKRQAETARLQEVIVNAPQDQAQDALLDAIAAQRAPDRAPDPAAAGLRKQPDGVVVP